MSCQEFESVSVELARGSLVDAAARGSAHAHAEACRGCAARLRRERALTAALREAGASMREWEAPARVEAALLSAVRERRRAAPVVEGAGVAGARTGARAGEALPSSAAVTSSASAPPAGAVALLFAPRFRRAFVATAIAASLLLAAFVAWRALNSGATNTSGGIAEGVLGAGDAANSPTGPVDKRQNAGGKQDIKAATATARRAVENGPQEVLASMKQADRGANRVRSSPRPRVSPGGEALPISFRVDGGSVTGEPVSSASAGGAGAADIASPDFMPLNAAGDSAPLDGGQMVRVEVSRAALAAFGLPVNGARAGETVKADVLLAHDGTARAIRLLP
jgi:hypothetical protein